MDKESKCFALERHLPSSIFACLFLASLVLRASAADKPISFSRDILPILSDNCFQCHGPDETSRKAKLRLDTKEGAFRVKDGVTVVMPKDSAKSELFRRISSADPDEVMPPAKSNHKLTRVQIDNLRRWIDQGAVWGEHWAFEKLTRPEPPEVSAVLARRVINPIDAFIAARLGTEGLDWSPEASKETLIRRVSLDLTGLPPMREAVAAFTDDRSKAAYDNLVDRLLGSPAYGERMAWDWLDAARYADSNGYQGDSERTMWPWRDWVVAAFNRNLPFDRFTIMQLAGDLLPDATLEQKLATGFCRNHMINGEGGRIPEENRVDYVMDMSETTGTVWLGLTFNCCRCHDHKFDPLTRKDYYSMFAFFNQTPVDGSGGDPQSKPNIEIPSKSQRAARGNNASNTESASKTLEGFERSYFSPPEGKSIVESTKAAELPDAVKEILKTPVQKRNHDQLSSLEKQFDASAPEYGARLKQLREALDERDRIRSGIPRVMVMEDMAKPRKTFMLEKGIYDKTGEEVTAAIPAKLGPLPSGSPPNRLGLAEWLVSPENPLTARVIVNRLWQQFFGIGLVKTSEDFGVQGETPSHPELLDWLASEFVSSGWDVKHLCRLIVTSNTYRQSSKVSAELAERDPQNRLLARGARFRMPSWMIRDQALAVGGLLVREVGGAPVNPYQPAGVWEEATFGAKKYRQDHGESLYRRSLYTFWRRIVAPTMFFDTATRQTCTVKQPRTNTPLQALVTLDDITYVEASRALAEKAMTMAGPSVEARIRYAFDAVMARQPTASEEEVLQGSLKQLRAEYVQDSDAARRLVAVGESKHNTQLDPAEHAAYTGLCMMILNLDEALTKE